MLQQSEAGRLQINANLIESLQIPMFASQKPLWCKNQGSIMPDLVENLKKYEFTKIGKMLGLSTVRYMALHNHTLYYFDSPYSTRPLGSCEIQNIYSEWFQVQAKKFALVLSNGRELTAFFFREDSFKSENWEKLAKYTVQLGFYNKFDILQQLGAGSFARVFKTRDILSGQQYSAKAFSRLTSLDTLKRQICVLRQMIGAKNVIQYVGMFETNNEIILLTKYISGKDLKAMINYAFNLSSNEIKTIIQGISYGLLECHKRMIIHRDIKPQNVIVDFDTLKPTIIDFGLALDLKKECAFNKSGTIAYMAPQVYTSQQKNASYCIKSDLFSLGIISHILMIGFSPLKIIKTLNVCLKED